VMARKSVISENTGMAPTVKRNKTNINFLTTEMQL